MKKYRLGYNTNGFTCHPLSWALEIIGQLGYECVAITLDHCALNPWNRTLNQEIQRVEEILKRYSLSCIIETGSRFLLDPWHKHEPTLISAEAQGRTLRLDFLKRALYIASRLGAEAISLWSGKKPDSVSDREAWQWLAEGCQELTVSAKNEGVSLAFEPEPGMFLETLSQYQKLKEMVNRDNFGLTLDLGHTFLKEAVTVGECIQKYRQDVMNIHIEDMNKEVHEHLFFGEGNMNFLEIFQVLRKIDYDGPLTIELSHHSHNAVEVAKKARDFLMKYV
ncbi:MAG: sugar phosphate isomerase/epimerase family protein [Thermodesulfobacteriota bacterium]|nr:sugar phosphate isomerase/epimerase family protein [Thermodesulfobacteriota bacterium]